MKTNPEAQQLLHTLQTATYSPPLDAMLPRDLAAERWFQLPIRTVAKHSRFKRSPLVVFKIGRQEFMHPRSVLAKLMDQSGMRPELIAAALAQWQPKPTNGTEIK